MDIDDEAERLAAAHPWAGTGWAQEREAVPWMPQHAVPRHPKQARYVPTPETVELQIAADIARIDQELDPQAPPQSKVFGNLLNNPWPSVSGWFEQNFVDAYTDPLWVQVHVDFGTIEVDQWQAIALKMSRRMLNPPKPGPGRPKQAKTYETPNRRAKRSVKANMSWIDRAKQSADARKR
jgi:hypothetical protein